MPAKRTNVKRGGDKKGKYAKRIALFAFQLSLFSHFMDFNEMDPPLMLIIYRSESSMCSYYMY